ncbi:MAG: hypothetical protein HQ446_06050 [Polaromonas sp.]|nr:hypothetical protein [Polaromonas sp.]
MSQTKLNAPVISCASLALACTSCTTSAPPLPEEQRPHDRRVFTPPVLGTTFASMSSSLADLVDMNTTSRWAGVLKGAA